MNAMRAFIAFLFLAVAGPAAAQDFASPLAQFQIDELRAQQQLAQQRAVAQANELMALEARLRTEQAIRDIQASRAPVQLPELPHPGAPPAAIDTSRLPAIPDAALAASNQRVREAAGDRR